MKVRVHRGLLIAVLARDEHCPPHVHVGTADWDARFEFAFWHNSVRLWDVLPVQATPSISLLEDLRQVVMQPKNLKRARELWWLSRQTLCLYNQQWDTVTEEVVGPKALRQSALPIEASHFDATKYSTVLNLAGRTHPLEIRL